MQKYQSFEQLRPLLFSIAYRMLGSVSEAEDAVQETWLRYEGSATQPTSPKAFLSSVVTRISIDVLRSSRIRREQYIGEWFPEPLVEDPYEDPEHAADLADSISMAALVLLERLSPLERAVFVLRDVFHFDFPEISATVGRSEAACRQLAVRARRHMQESRPRFEADRGQQDALAERFFEAFRDGDVQGLRELLANDVELVSDSGGKAPSLPHSIVGRDRASRLLATIAAPSARIGLTLDLLDINRQPGAIIRDDEGRVLQVMVLDILDGRIQRIRTIINPDKLAHLGPTADAWVMRDEFIRLRREIR